MGAEMKISASFICAHDLRNYPGSFALSPATHSLSYNLLEHYERLA
jgi:hypothetical protein